MSAKKRIRDAVKHQEKPIQRKHPIEKEDVERNSDPKIDEDFPGFPHGTAREGIIHKRRTN
jgi:hypothetical protein